jgi:predicted metal-binding membrane protein
MGRLFVGGVMNRLWIVAIAVFVLLEKTVPFGETGGASSAAR